MAENDATPALRIQPTGPQLRADRRGYVLDGRQLDGFADRPDLDQRGRRLLAEWARAFTPQTLQPDQAELLGQPSLALSTTEEQLRDAAIENAEHDVPRAIDIGLYGRLTADEVRVVREPWLQLGGDPRREYPLNVAELATLTGTTPRQIRSWAEGGLIPVYWIDGRRHFFSAAAIHAMALRDLERNEVRAITRVLTADEDDPVPELLAAATAASQRRYGHPARLAELIRLAQHPARQAEPAQEAPPVSSTVRARRHRSGRCAPQPFMPFPTRMALISLCQAGGRDPGWPIPRLEVDVPETIDVGEHGLARSATVVAIGTDACTTRLLYRTSDEGILFNVTALAEVAKGWR